MAEMLLSDEDIRLRVMNRSLVIEPFKDELVKPAGYDLRCGESLDIAPEEHRLTFTLERIGVPLDLAGILHLRSSFVREGLIGGLSLVDPGFKGQLTIALYNAGDAIISISRGEPFIQASFIELSRSASRGYSGKYQYSEGVTLSLR
ncbi:dCTP deaminase [Candidatus Bathyarchaeota archaeon]|nr:dCTP deaminase [Candidatus Bathyarchaeota archaeon]